MKKFYRFFLIAIPILVSSDPVQSAALGCDNGTKENFDFVYYNPLSRKPLTREIEDSGRDPINLPKIGFRGLPCSCQNLACGCCAGMNITLFNFDHKACSNFTVDPHNIQIDMQVFMDDNEIFKNSINGRNPPPFCLPLPYAPFIQFCVRFYDIRIKNNRFHTCIDFETKFISSPILILHFDCMRAGTDGISWAKPGEEISSDSSSSSTITASGDVGSEDYDEVAFETNDADLGINSTSTLSPADEATIGQLKF